MIKCYYKRDPSEIFVSSCGIERSAQCLDRRDKKLTQHLFSYGMDKI